MHWHNVNMEDNNEERTESASETHRAENPESMESEHDEEEERSREEHIVVSHKTKVFRLMIVQMKLWQRHLSF